MAGSEAREPFDELSLSILGSTERLRAWHGSGLSGTYPFEHVYPGGKVGELALRLVDQIAESGAHIEEIKDDVLLTTAERVAAGQQWALDKHRFNFFTQLCVKIDQLLPNTPGGREGNRPSGFNEVVDQAHGTVSDIIRIGRFNKGVTRELQGTLDEARDAFQAEPYDHFRQGSYLSYYPD